MDLYDRFSQGDPAAFEALFRRHQRDVHRWVYRIVRNRAEAEDLTVETFWRIYRSRARFDASRPFGPWARRVATNLALNRLRRLHLHSPMTVDAERHQPPDALEQRALREAIVAVFFELSPKLRLVATLAIVEQVPYREIADAVGISIEAVKSRAHRAARQLREKLVARGITP